MDRVVLGLKLIELDNGAQGELEIRRVAIPGQYLGSPKDGRLGYFQRLSRYP